MRVNSSFSSDDSDREGARWSVKTRMFYSKESGYKDQGQYKRTEYFNFFVFFE